MLSILLAATLTVSVPENRSIEGGRTIDLNVTVVERSDKPDAIIILAGGPGVAATGMEGYAKRTFAGTDRDLVLVDARGTGKSNLLRCELPGSEHDPQGYFTSWLDLDAVAKCRKELEQRADLTQYTTAAIADDLEHVRRHLGYAQMNLYGTSYGTRVALELMRRYPKSLRTVILDGVVPPTLAGPTEFALDADRTLKAVFALCRADASCSAAFPDLEADYAKVLKDAEDGVTVNAPKPVSIPRGMFGEIMRNFLYSPEVYVRLPLAIHSAASGDWMLFAEMATRYARGIRGLSYGMFLSVSCAEDVPRFDVAGARKAAEGTLLGSYRVDQQVEACELWPRGKVDPVSAKPVKSSVPTIIVSGELDPATPPRHGDQVLRTLRRGRHIVIPHGSHSGDTGGCLEKVLSEFVNEGSGQRLDTSCVAKVQRPPFALANATTSGKN
jgi:pimeloyl-ACP methyl ester carboxylesterase